MFIVLAKQARTLRKNGNLTAWLFGVTWNVCRHALRCRVNRLTRWRSGHTRFRPLRPQPWQRRLAAALKDAEAQMKQ